MAPRRAAAVRRDSASEDDEEAVAPTATASLRAEDFRKPLGHAQANLLDGLARDHRELAKKYMESVDVLSRAAENVQEADDGDDLDATKETLDKIEIQIREMIDKSTGYDQSAAALTKLRDRLSRNEEIDNAKTVYLDLVSAAQAKYKKRTARQKYAEVQAYVEYRDAIWRAGGLDRGPMPPVTAQIDREEGDEDDDLEVGSSTVQMVCPIAGSVMSKPMKNPRCPHRIDQDSLDAYFKPRSAAKPCPVSGCSNVINVSELKLDERLQHAIKQSQRRERARRDKQTTQTID